MALRTCIVLIFLSITFSIHAQTLDGGFLNSDLNEGYYFSKDGDFSWFRFFNGRKELGNGKYRIVNDSILFDFGTSPRDLDVSIQKSVHSPGNVVNAGLTIMYATGTPYSNLKFELGQSNVSGTTDSRGTARFDIHDPPKSDTLKLAIPGGAAIHVDINDEDFVVAIVVDNTIKYKENSIVSYKFDRSRKKLVLANSPYKSVSYKKYKKRSS